MTAELFLRAALRVIDEAGDAGARKVVTAGLTAAAPLRRIPRPGGRVKRVAWCAEQLAMFANDPARAYARLRELCIELFEPLSTQRRVPAPAPEVALTLKPDELVETIAPSPRVLARELAIAADFDSGMLLVAPTAPQRVLGVRSIAQAKLGQFAGVLATLIAVDPDPLVRAEIVDVCSPANEKQRAKIAAALAPHVANPDAAIRVNVLDGLRALKLPLGGPPLAVCLADPVAAVRAAAARSVSPANPAADVVGRLSDEDPIVRAEALDAVARCPALHEPALVARLVALVRRHDSDDTRTALYLLGKLHGPAEREEIVATLDACVAGPRSDVARAAAVVLTQLGAPQPEVPVETRMLRAARELAASDRDTQVAGLFEAQRLGDHARSLVPAIRRLGDLLAPAADAASRATFAQVRDVLAALGVPPAELPRVITLEPWRGIVPRERAVHGAYAIASIDHGATSGLGLWDHATGALLFAVEDADLLELLPGRAEVGVLRTGDDGWLFERRAVPSGKPIAVLAIPDVLARGWPSSLAAAADLVTVWCADETARYRFHIKLGDPDKLLDDEPNVDERSRNR